MSGTRLLEPPVGHSFQLPRRFRKFRGARAHVTGSTGSCVEARMLLPNRPKFVLMIRSLSEFDARGFNCVTVRNDVLLMQCYVDTFYCNATEFVGAPGNVDRQEDFQLVNSRRKIQRSLLKCSIENIQLQKHLFKTNDLNVAVGDFVMALFSSGTFLILL